MDNTVLYDFLKAAERPMSIGEIHGSEPFSGMSRRELACGLMTLSKEKLAYRSLRQGKAYYSADPKEGVCRNPCQTNIEKIASAMNQAIAQAQNPELAQLGKLFQMADAISTAEPESPKDCAEFTYREGTVARGEGYSIGVPDGFRLELGMDGRDFVAWLPSEHSNSPEDARITLYAGTLNKETNGFVEEHVLCPEYLAAVIQMTQWEMKKQTDRLLGVSEMCEIPKLGQVSGSYLYSGKNYQIMVAFVIGLKQFRVTLNEPDATREKYHQAVLDWIATLKLDKPFYTLKRLDSEEFLPLNEESQKAWQEAAEQMMERIAGVLNGKLQVRIRQFQYEQQYGTASMTLLKKDIREIAANGLIPLEQMCEQAGNFLERLCREDPENPRLLEVYETVENLHASLEQYFNLDNDPMKVTSQRQQELKARLNIPRIAQLKAEKERLEAEKKAAEEAERIAKEKAEAAEREAARQAVLAAREKAMEQAKQEQEENYQRRFQETKRSCAVKYKKLKDEKASLEREQQILSERLPTLGMFKGGEKKQIQQRLGEIADALSNNEQETAKLVPALQKADRELKTAMEQALEKRRVEIEREHPMPREKTAVQPQALTPVQQQNNRIKQEILDYMAPGELYSVSDILEGVTEMYDCTNQRTSALLRQLVDEDKLERVEMNRKAYFRLV